MITFDFVIILEFPQQEKTKDFELTHKLIIFE